MNAVADKAVNTDKERDIAANKKVNATADEAVDADTREDVIAGKQLNAAAKLSILIKDQITRWTKLGD